MGNKDELILMGVISSAHGICGHLVVKSFTTPSRNIINLKITDKNSIPINLKFIKYNSKQDLICKVNNITNRNDAEAIVKTALYCTRKDLPNLEMDEFYINDLKGMKVLNNNHEEIGIITEVLNYGASDIIEIQFYDQKIKELFPFTKDLFPVIGEDWVEMNRD